MNYQLQNVILGDNKPVAIQCASAIHIFKGADEYRRTEREK